MNGLEAIDEMKNGRLVRDNDGLVYKIENGEIFVNTFSDLLPWQIAIIDFSKKFELVPEYTTGWERVAKGEDYYRIYTLAELDRIEDNGDKYDECLYDHCNYFSTREKGEEIEFKQRLFRKLQRFADENNEEIDWNATTPKYYIDYVGDELGVEIVILSRSFGVVYFSSEELAEQAIKLFKEDLLKYFNYGLDKEVD